MFKFSYDWIKDYHKDITLERLFEILRIQGFEIDTVQKIDDDTAVAIEVKANRPDMLSHKGVAREISLFLGKELPEKTFETKIQKENYPVKVEVKSECCRRFSGLVINGIDNTVRTPEIMKKRLTALGINLINPVVDITNYIMLDIGQPLHAYDIRKIRGDLEVKNIEENIKIKTLGEKEADLKKGNTVICDKNEVLCIAGIIGAENGTVDKNTTDIFLEAANFNEIDVRLTSRALKISTPSSFRFERGVNIKNTLNVLMSCAETIVKICGGRIYMSAFDYCSENLEDKFLNLRVNRTNMLIGINLTQEEIIKNLKKYDFECKIVDGNNIKVKIPDYRLDLEKEVDLIEEVARIYGYDNLEPEMPTIQTSYKKNKTWENADVLRETMVGLRFNEVINYAFIPENTTKTFEIESGERLFSDLVIQNPIGNMYALMRPFMVYSILSSLAYNYSINNHDLAIFEIGKTYFKDKKCDTGCREIDTFGAIFSGVRLQKGFGQEKDIKYNFYDLLNYVNVIFNRFNQKFEIVPANLRFCEEGTGFEIISNGEIIGFLGELAKQKLSKIQNVKLIKDKIFFFEINIEKLNETGKKLEFESKFPPVERLYNLVCKKTILSKSIYDIIKNSSEFVRKITVKDVYEDKNMAENSHSILFEVNYCEKNATLTTEQIEEIENKFLKKLSDELGVTLKG